MPSQRTVDYSALERTCGSEKGDPRSDIYFLGCVFYQMLTGQLPMEESRARTCSRRCSSGASARSCPLSEHRHAPDPELARDRREDDEGRAQGALPDHGRGLADLEAYEKRGRSGFIGLESRRRADEPEYLVDLDDDLRRDRARHRGEAAAGTSPCRRGRVRRSPAGRSLCVEAQSEIQDAFRKTLTKMGYRVILVGDPERAAERYRESPPDAVIFDCRRPRPRAVDAHSTCTRKPSRTVKTSRRSSSSAPAGRSSLSREDPDAANSVDRDDQARRDEAVQAAIKRPAPLSTDSARPRAYISGGPFRSSWRRLRLGPGEPRAGADGRWRSCARSPALGDRRTTAIPATTTATPPEPLSTSPRPRGASPRGAGRARPCGCVAGGLGPQRRERSVQR